MPCIWDCINCGICPFDLLASPTPVDFLQYTYDSATITEFADREFATLALLEIVYFTALASSLGQQEAESCRAQALCMLGHLLPVLACARTARRTARKQPPIFLALQASRETDTMQVPTVLEYTLLFCPREAKAVCRVMLAP